MINPGIDRNRVAPNFFHDLAGTLESIYQQIQHDLIVMLAQHISAGRKKFGVSEFWKGIMLSRTGEIREAGIDTIMQYVPDIQDATAHVLRQAAEAGISLCEHDLALAFADDPRKYVPPVEERTEAIIKAYYDQAIDKCNLVNTVMLNSTVDAYKYIVGIDINKIDKAAAVDQQVLNAQTALVVTGAITPQQAKQNAVNEMSKNGTIALADEWNKEHARKLVELGEDGLTGFIDKSGRSWSADAYISMDIRTTCANAAREAVDQRNHDYGNHLFCVSSHAGARPLCYPYQGKVFSDDGTSGNVKDLMGNIHHYDDISTTSYGEAAGLFGINCGHMKYPFVDGYSMIRTAIQDPEANEAQYKKNQEQRAKERAIRALKTRADIFQASGDSAAAKRARERAKEAIIDLRKWCVDNGQTYRAERTRVTKPNK